MNLFVRQKNLALALGLAMIASGIFVPAAKANLMFDIRQDPLYGNTAFGSGTSSSDNYGRSLTVPAAGGTDTMDLYALINDGSAANAIPQAGSNPGVDALGAVIQGLGLQFGATGGTINTFTLSPAIFNSGSANSGTEGSLAFSNNGVSGWGLSTASQSLNVHATAHDIFFTANGSGNVNTANGFAGTAGDSGFTEFLLGTFSVTFPASFSGSNSLQVNLGTVSDKENWGENTSAVTSAAVSSNPGTAAHTVGGGSTATPHTYMFAPVTFTPAGGSTPVTSGSISAATLTLSQTSAYLYGGAGTATFGLTNGASSVLSLTGSSVTNLSGALNNTSTIAASSSAADTLTLATSVPFGLNTASITVTASGAATGGTTGTASATYNVVGLLTKGSNYTFGTTGTGALVAAGTSFAGVSTTLSGIGSYGINNTSATLLAGSAASTLNPTMAWRSAQPGVDKGTGGVPLISDVVSINGLGSGTVPTYALQVTYDPTVLGSADTAANIAAGSLYLGTRNTTTGTFGNAAYASNTGTAIQPGADFVPNSPLSFASFISNVFPGTTPSTISQADLNLILGSWGVDTAAHAAWAVVNYDADFGVVPEPGTFALLGAAIGATALAYSRRRKVAQAV
jgi:hypothetical protein